ncbi:glycosyltransferase family 2 protein [Kordiimonas marina]|uniref:glycosyltransferase family 2 protein n=1 Tax=Kordiimonas marina TaxID=2872312 RepID=UPI001FF347D3|nr:glycosyltransferase family 2 protein [Kordiimonas marina]MCJ9430787.1 glycosyltransferase family 2 protein [Kordiimonas marina]
MPNSKSVSFVIPVYNEAESLAILVGEIHKAAADLALDHEILFVNDGSTDESVAVIRGIMDQDDRVGFLNFRRNFGKAAALAAGFRHAEGDYIVTMDGDLQDDPAELGKLLAKLDDGADCVSGWKENRLDPVDKTLPSKIFNFVVGRVSGVKLHDMNCGYKAYKREAVEDLSLYGEFHRFIPVLLHWQGFKVDEVAVNHRERQFGHSKYGLSRLIKGMFDLFTIVLTTRFSVRPLHIFGLAGMALGLIGGLILSYLSALWFMGLGPIGNRPLLFLGLLCVMVGVNIFGIGLLAEFIQHMAAEGRTPYRLRETIPPRHGVGRD